MRSATQALLCTLAGDERRLLMIHALIILTTIVVASAKAGDQNGIEDVTGAEVSTHCATMDIPIP